ncbi:MAG: hypothetical protein KBT34_05360 [Prevotella sp.]|nr:hypothetical protein [Candidatus Prevotella equi]
MKIDEKNPKHIIAADGMVLHRTVGTSFTAKEVFLGKVKVDGVLVEDKVENYEEITRPERKEPKHGRKENE